MFSPLKTFKSNLFLLIGFLIISSFSLAQESTTYYRYFEIELKQSVDIKNDVKADLLRETPFLIHVTCGARNSVIVAVPADYPKRVHQIEDEIKSSLESVISTKKSKSLHTIKAIDLDSFCQ